MAARLPQDRPALDLLYFNCGHHNVTLYMDSIIMPSEENETANQSEPREVRVGRLNRRPGPNKAIISLAVLVALVILFVLIFLKNRF